MSPPSERPPRATDSYPERARDGSRRLAEPKTAIEYHSASHDARTSSSGTAPAPLPCVTRPIYVPISKSVEPAASVATSRARLLTGGPPARPPELASFVTTLPGTVERQAELHSAVAHHLPAPSVCDSQPSVQPAQTARAPEGVPRNTSDLEATLSPRQTAPLAPGSQNLSLRHAQVVSVGALPAAGETDSVDVRVLVGDQVPLPELGKQGEDSSSRWHTQGHTLSPELAAEPRPAASSEPELAYEHLKKRRRGPQEDGDSDEASALERSLRPLAARKVFLFAACAVAVGLLSASFFLKSKQSSLQVAAAPLAGPVAAPTAAPALNPSAPVAAPTAAPALVPSAPVAAPTAAPALAPSAPVSTLPPAAVPDATRADRQDSTSGAPLRTAAVERVDRGGATPQSAAALYIRGQYKEALAEYRLLASAHPEKTVYAEFARVLKRKLFDTCVRTQPNRREQCKQL